MYIIIVQVCGDSPFTLLAQIPKSKRTGNVNAHNYLKNILYYISSNSVRNILIHNNAVENSFRPITFLGYFFQRNKGKSLIIPVNTSNRVYIYIVPVFMYYEELIMLKNENNAKLK